MSAPSPTPIAYQSLPSHAPGTVGKSGEILVAHKGAVLPPLCIKCGQPSTAGPIQKQLTWVHPLAYLGLLGGIIPLLIIVLLLQKKGKLSIYVCDAHRKQRTLLIISTTLGALAGLGCLFLAATMENGFVALFGVVLFFVSLFVAAIRVPLVKVKRITDQEIMLKRVPQQILADLPSIGRAV